MRKEITVTIKILDCSIDVTLRGNDIYFHHITTGQLQEDLEQCFVGWSEQNQDEEFKWEMLKDSIKEMIEDDMLETYICDYEEEGEFNIGDTPYSPTKEITGQEFFSKLLEIK